MNISETDKASLYETRVKILSGIEPDREELIKALSIISTGVSSREISIQQKAAQKARSVVLTKPLDDLFSDC